MNDSTHITGMVMNVTIDVAAFTTYSISVKVCNLDACATSPATVVTTSAAGKYIITLLQLCSQAVFVCDFAPLTVLHA